MVGLPARALIPAAIAVIGVLSAQASGYTEASSSGRPLATAFVGPEFRDPDQGIVFKRSRAAGATFVRLCVWWSEVAPGGESRPLGFEPRDPADPLYRWGIVDQQVQAAVSSGLEPILCLLDAPVWAQDGRRRRGQGPVRPSPGALADFATAAAERYAGAFGGLPRVRYWQVWNEPNLSIFLEPQSESGRLISPGWYRSMVNAVARAVHAVHRDNVVIAGGLAPFGGPSNDPSGGTVEGQERTHPLEFMRKMLCVSRGARPKPTCLARTEFDVWSHHPYTYGAPTHSAFHPDDVSLGDLGEMRRVLEAAEAMGHIRTREAVGFWVTEFSYDSRPEDPRGLPLSLHARWVSEALYRMWRNGVTLVTWWLTRDRPFPQEMFQSGLYLRGPNGIESDKPKPALRAFRFPFVAFKRDDRSIAFWGRTPTSTRKAVVVEQMQDSRWKRLATPAVDRYGIFQGRSAGRKSRGAVRARLLDRSDASLPFGLTVPKDFRFCPWGSYC